jgi:hypothetical protein
MIGVHLFLSPSLDLDGELEDAVPKRSFDNGGGLPTRRVCSNCLSLWRSAASFPVESLAGGTKEEVSEFGIRPSVKPLSSPSQPAFSLSASLKPTPRCTFKTECLTDTSLWILSAQWIPRASSLASCLGIADKSDGWKMT